MACQIARCVDSIAKARCTQMPEAKMSRRSWAGGPPNTDLTSGRRLQLCFAFGSQYRRHRSARNSGADLHPLHNSKHLGSRDCCYTTATTLTPPWQKRKWYEPTYGGGMHAKLPTHFTSNPAARNKQADKVALPIIPHTIGDRKQDSTADKPSIPPSPKTSPSFPRGTKTAHHHYFCSNRAHHQHTSAVHNTR